MTSIKGISKETVEAAIKSAHSKYSYLCGGNAMTNDGDFYVVSKAIAEITKASIASLLASGDVVLRKDVEELKDRHRVAIGNWETYRTGCFERDKIIKGLVGIIEDSVQCDCAGFYTCRRCEALAKLTTKPSEE